MQSFCKTVYNTKLEKGIVFPNFLILKAIYFTPNTVITGIITGDAHSKNKKLVFRQYSKNMSMQYIAKID